MTMQRLAIALAATAACGLAQADTIAWNTWTGATTGTMDTGTATVGVDYRGEGSYQGDMPSWEPASSWVDGSVVENHVTGGILHLVGGSSEVLNTITFSTPVTDPVFAIWSLGQPGHVASFDFTNATPTFVSGGPNAEFGGSSIQVVGDSVYGEEGNGTVQFQGTFTSISWFNPIAESYYGLNVGIAAAVPEPATTALMLAGLLAVGAAARRRRG